MSTATASGIQKASLERYEPQISGKKVQRGSMKDTLTFGFNPKDYAVSMQAGWKAEPKKTGPLPPEFNGIGPRSLSFEMFFDASEREGADVSTEVAALFECLRPTARSITAKTPFPLIVVFRWGSQQFCGVMESVQASFTRFDRLGHALRASCKVAMKEFEQTPGRQNPTSGGDQFRRSHTVVLGDSLASIANAEYGTPTLWRAIARVNRLLDPFELPTGMELLLPPISEAKALG